MSHAAVCAALACAVVGACQFARPEDQQPVDAPPTGCTTAGPNATECPPTAPVCSASGECAGCATNSECGGRPLTPVCFGEPTGMCVACDDNGQQAGTPGGSDDHCQVPGQQVCDATSHACRECRADQECASGVCESGTCVDRSLVLRVTPTGSDNPTCDTAAPCRTPRAAVGATDTLRRFVVIEPGEYSDSVEVDINNKNLRIVATGATLRRTGTGPLVALRGTSVVTLVDGTLDAGGAGVDGVETASTTQLVLEGTTVRRAASAGVRAMGRLTAHRARFEDNGTWGVFSTFNGPFELTRSVLIHNGHGGLSLMAASAVILNNYFVKNGVANTVPALQINGLTSPASSRIEFNTIAGNVADSSAAAGAASCSSTTIVLKNSILYFNNGINQISGCTARHSSVQGATPDGPSGLINDPPSFINTGNDNFGIMPGSAMTGKADPATDLTGQAAVDFEGQTRPMGGAVADIGADEIP